MSVYLETKQNVIQSTPMADSSFGFTEVISNKKLNEFIKNGEGTDSIKFSSQYFLTGNNFV